MVRLLGKSTRGQSCSTFVVSAHFPGAGANSSGLSGSDSICTIHHRIAVRKNVWCGLVVKLRFELSVSLFWFQLLQVSCKTDPAFRKYCLQCNCTADLSTTKLWLHFDQYKYSCWWLTKKRMIVKRIDLLSRILEEVNASGQSLDDIVWH